MSGTFIPNAFAAMVAEEKVRLYLLEPDHPGNGGKAAFFQRFGFSIQQWEMLRDALEQHPLLHPMTGSLKSRWGVKYEVRCALRSPDGRNPCVRSIWVVDSSNPDPRLVTAYAYP